MEMEGKLARPIQGRDQAAPDRPKAGIRPLRSSLGPIQNGPWQIRSGLRALERPWLNAAQQVSEKSSPAIAATPWINMGLS